MGGLIFGYFREAANDIAQQCVVSPHLFRWGRIACMAYAILRVQKLKSAVAVHRSMKHAFREQDTPNADPNRTPNNTHIGARNVKEGMDAFRSRLPEKHRKDAVLVIEYLITASPEGMHAKSRVKQDRYFQDGLDWLREKHGAENVIYAGIHRDETTPHMYAYVVPRVGEKLNCRAFLGGARALSEMQTEFAEKVGLRHGLERGIEGSKAKHQRVSRFYAQINAPIQEPRILESDLIPRKYKPKGVLEKLHLTSRIEAPETVAERITKETRAAYAPLLEKAAAVDLATKKAKESEETAKRILRQAKPMLEAVKNLSTANQAKLLHLVEFAGAKLLKEQKEAILQKQKERQHGRSRGDSGFER